MFYSEEQGSKILKMNKGISFPQGPFRDIREDQDLWNMTGGLKFWHGPVHHKYILHIMAEKLQIGYMYTDQSYFTINII